MKLYRVYDRKVNEWMLPFPADNNVSAIRMFEQSLSGPDNMAGKYPDDFTLWYCGDCERGQPGVFVEEEPREICTARDFIAGEPLEVVK